MQHMYLLFSLLMVFSLAKLNGLSVHMGVVVINGTKLCLVISLNLHHIFSKFSEASANGMNMVLYINLFVDI